MPLLTHFHPTLKRDVHFDKLKFKINSYLDFESLDESTIKKYHIEITERPEHWEKIVYDIKEGIWKRKEVKNFYRYNILYTDEYNNKINIMTRQWDSFYNHSGSITTTGSDDFKRIVGLEESLRDIFGLLSEEIKPSEIEISFNFESDPDLEAWCKKHIRSRLRLDWWRINSKKGDGTYTDYIGNNRSPGMIKLYDRSYRGDLGTTRLEVTIRKKRLKVLNLKKPKDIFSVDWVNAIFDSGLLQIVDVDWSKFPKKHRNKYQIVYTRGDIVALKERLKADGIKVYNFYKPNDYSSHLKKYLDDWNQTLIDYKPPVDDWLDLMDDL